MEGGGVQIRGLGLGWQELEVGTRFRTVGRTITEADLTAFVNASGMVELLFTNREYLASKTPYGGRRLVPAACVYALAEGLLIQSALQSTGIAFLGMELEVKGPTFADDTIHVEWDVTEVKPTSKNRGLVRTRNQVINQRGEVVLVYTPLRMLKASA